MNANITTVPENAVLNLGGYTGYKAEEWNRYFWSSVLRFYPWYYLLHRFDKQNANWKKNDCIYESLRQNLLYEFGVILPERTLFQVFNRGGKGLLPADVLRAISAVIEPLGLEIDRVVVSNETLRGALGYPERMVDVAGAQDFHRKPGICMINIENGYSHAFYWKSLDARKFTDPAFRLALRLRWKSAPSTELSRLNGLDVYRTMLEGYFAGQPKFPADAAAWVLAEAGALRSVLEEESPTRDAVIPRLVSVNTLLASAMPDRFRPTARDVLEAGEMLLTIFRSAYPST